MRALLFLALTTLACAPKHETQEPSLDPRIKDLAARQQADLDEAKTLRDPANNWLVTGGDGMLWSGKYAAVTCDVDIEAAETEPGKFSRDPDGETSTNPNWSDWSKDMGAGLLAYAWRCKNLALLERHAAYGQAHKALANAVPVWQMGSPVGDGRGLYLPAFIGRLYQTVFALGGEDSNERLWPDLYSLGLTDFRAHLQVMNIWHRGEVAEALREQEDSDATVKDDVRDDADGPSQGLTTLDVTEDQFEVLKYQAERDPRDPFFQAVYGTYTGNMGPAIDACLADDDYAGEYVRCDGTPRACLLAARLFACDLVLRRYGVTL